jgi:8-amino-7-oxononanoate synthase
LKRSHQLRESLKSVLQAGEKIPECAGAITPVLLGENRKALEKARQLQKLGLDIRAIRPPTVPENTARLRITTQWNQTEADLNQLIEGFRGH